MAGRRDGLGDQHGPVRRRDEGVERRLLEHIDRDHEGGAEADRQARDADRGVQAIPAQVAERGPKGVPEHRRLRRRPGLGQ
jgi:hypothetical protein